MKQDEMWEAYQELSDHLSSEMLWKNCRFPVLEFWMELYYKKLSEDLVLWAYLNAVEQLGMSIEEWEEHCDKDS